MGSHGWSLPEPQLAVAVIARQGLGENHIAVVSGAGEKRYHGYLIGIELVQNGIESRLTLMEGHGYFVEDSVPAQILRYPAHQRIRSAFATGAMSRENQRSPPAHN
jgi:hypothetical protein